MASLAPYTGVCQHQVVCGCTWLYAVVCGCMLLYVALCSCILLYVAVCCMYVVVCFYRMLLYSTPLSLVNQ